MFAFSQPGKRIITVLVDRIRDGKPLVLWSPGEERIDTPARSDGDGDHEHPKAHDQYPSKTDEEDCDLSYTNLQC